MFLIVLFDVEIEHAHRVWEQSLNLTSTASTVDVGFNPPSSHTTTCALTNPLVPNRGHPATPCPSPLHRDVGWFNPA